MAERDLEKEEHIVVDFPHTDVMTGDRNRHMQIYYQLVQSMKSAVRIDIIVSFLMESGVKMLMRDLGSALDRGAKLRILTGNYLGITQPSALYLLRHELGDRVDLRMYNEKERSFHPKSYIFHYEDYSDIFIGSSNISRSALTSGIEWNYRFSSRNDPENYRKFFETFEDLFLYHSFVVDDAELRRYSKNWHRPNVEKDLERYEQREDEDTNVRMLYEPRGAQIEALCALENSRAEGARRGLIYAATGVGKTYLAAFDSAAYKRVLFVAHREEILKQAAISFRNVRASEDFGFFNGEEKVTDKSVIFASVATLGRPEYLKSEFFPPDYFQYLIVDEIHHGVTKQYRNIIDYFKPEFMLGLTATPERMDGRNIYELCDYNVPYEIPLKEAINKGMLVPFRYYGVYDETDYSGLHLVRGHYDEKELNETYIGNVRRYELIYKYYKKYGSKRALGFCCSRAHAEEMAKEFSERGIPSVAVYSNADGEYSEERTIAINKLRDGKIRVIFSVDMFNEGLDIPEIDMVLFLRPTESPVVFMQQLGRGLRKVKGKEYLKVLDFIGNYHKAGNVRTFLFGREEKSRVLEENEKSEGRREDDLPDDCQVDFDLRLLDLFAEMDKKSIRLSEMIRREYARIREELDHVPSRMDLFTYMDNAVYELAVRNTKENPFRNYLAYRRELGDLDDTLEPLNQSIGREFLNLLETTSMSKVYKMPVLMAFYNGGDVVMKVDADMLLTSWKSFFNTGRNWRDLDPKLSYQEYREITDKKHLKKIIEMPVHFLTESGKGFFIQPDRQDNTGTILTLKPELEAVLKLPGFAEEMKDIIDYRTMHYYQTRYREER